MNRVILQIPMPKELKQSAETVALDYGFSSLQETIRVILRKLSKRELTLRIEEEKPVRLSLKAQRRYSRIITDIKKGKNVIYTKDAEDFLKKLRS